MDFAPILLRWRFLADALGMTLAITLPSIALGFAVGLLVAVARTYGGRLPRVVLGLYVDTMRAVPLLVILVWIYFAAPLLGLGTLGSFTAAILGLGLHLGAYMAEAIRAGLTSIRAGQMNAALALGMSRAQAVRRVILPQALVRMLPPIGSVSVIAIKDSAIASVIAVPELLRQSQVLSGLTYRSFEVYTLAMGLYFLLCYPVARGVDALYRRVAHLGAS